MWSLFPLSLDSFMNLIFIVACVIIFYESQEVDKYYNVDIQRKGKVIVPNPTYQETVVEEETEEEDIYVEEEIIEEEDEEMDEEVLTEMKNDVADGEDDEFDIETRHVNVPPRLPPSEISIEPSTQPSITIQDLDDRFSTCSILTSTSHLNTKENAQLSHVDFTKKEIQDVCSRIIFPYMPGCEPFGPNAQTLAKKYPTLSRPDIIRYLVARKGNLQAAEDMLLASMKWYSSHFPLKKPQIKAALLTQCFFPYGRAKDGTPIVYMRGGAYDANVASPQQYCLAAAYTIDYSLRLYPDQVNVTVIVCTDHVPGGPNQSADTNFIKLFCQVLSDNYPERLKRLAMYPFPWYGRAIWSIVKVFVDKRTQDKVMLLSSKASTNAPSPLPPELLDVLDINTMPECFGGKCKDSIVNLLETLDD